MSWIGNGIAFAALCVCATVLELNGHKVDGLWIVVVVWTIFGDFHPGKTK